jgi:O-acetyl-ADP-ribose deacetylase (regulator of RNase III)
MAQIVNRSGNIFVSDADALIVTVNCVGFMGKGMALECALRFPEVEQEYVKACKTGLIDIGHIYWVQTNSRKNLALFPTKRDFKHPSKLEYINRGLNALISDLKEKNISRVALPKLGSELGGLPWESVEKQVTKHFENIDIDLEIWSYAREENDSYLEQLITEIKLDLPGARKISRLTTDLLENVVAQHESGKLNSFTDLLQFKGVGKNSIKKLVQWNKSESKSFQEELLWE